MSYIDRLMGDNNHFYFKVYNHSIETRRDVVQDNVFLILGLWTLMREYFIPLDGRRHILRSYEVALTSSRSTSSQMGPSALDIPLSQLIKTSRVVPSPQTSMATNNNETPLASVPFHLHPTASFAESLSIRPRDLNLAKLVALADVRIHWTDNFSRHMLLSKHGNKRYIELFALPCAMRRALWGIGIPHLVMHEIHTSYSNLFNPVLPTMLHRSLGRVIGLPWWCWCLCCSSIRLREQEFRELQRLSSSSQGSDRMPITENGIREHVGSLPFDPILKHLAEKEASSWSQGYFPNIWPRIVALDQCLDEARPWNFWVLLRDKRNTVQYWTFL